MGLHHHTGELLHFFLIESVEKGFFFWLDFVTFGVEREWFNCRRAESQMELPRNINYDAINGEYNHWTPISISISSGISYHQSRDKTQ